MHSELNISIEVLKGLVFGQPVARRVNRRARDNQSGSLCLALVLSFVVSAPGFATISDVKEDIGFNDLSVVLAGGLPDGAGVAVMQIEAGTNFFPDTSNSDMLGKTIVDLSSTPSPGISGHATNVGVRFYGLTSSIAPGVTDVSVYNANAFLSEYLRFNAVPNSAPLASSSRTANHSWVGGNFVDNNNNPVPTATSNALRRLEWLIEEDEFIHIAAPDNNTATIRPFFTTAYNVITVGRTDGSHAKTVTALDSLYVANRAAVHAVVPWDGLGSGPTTSNAAPFGAATATLLVEAAHNNPGWSSGSTSNRAGATIYNAERSETVKAAIMAGASRFTVNTQAGSDISDYRIDAANQTDNGLDWRYGAGQLDINDSYAILAAGEKPSNQDGGSGSRGFTGFDYDPAFGGSSWSNSVAEYDLGTAAPNQFFAASLVWNLEVTGPAGFSAFNSNATLRDMQLYLIDTTGGANTTVASSTSLVDNTQNIYVELVAGRDYRLRVERSGGNFNWDYALAWRAHAFEDSDSDGSFDHLDIAPLDPCLPEVFVAACNTDTDSDGLSDFNEGEFTDTDGDGALDYQESNIIDDDGDGLFNQLESSVLDSDGDGIVDQQDMANNIACVPDPSMCSFTVPMLSLFAQWLAVLALMALGIAVRAGSKP